MIRFANLSLLSVLLVPAATAQAQAVAHDSALSSVSAAALHDSVALVSRSQLGTRYRLGAAQPGRRFDCSGLVQYVMSVFNVLLPRTAAAQARLGVAVPRDAAQLLPGDILTFGRGRRITHVGIYVGDGRYVHASSRRRTVVEVPLPDPDTRQGRLWKGARRVLSASARADSASVPQPSAESPAS
jgi:cell wall-associated NlpC family hydrolase